MKVYIIAEAGVNHNGSLDMALKLCDEAKNAGVDAIKFQTWKTENIVTKSAKLAEYQKNNIKDKIESQYEMLKKLELSHSDFITIKKYCDSINIEFLSTPDDEDSLEFLSSFNMKFIKIGSGEISNIPYLRKIGRLQQKIILSTGMSSLGDVEKAYTTLIDSGASEIILLHCTTNYPVSMDEVNLQAMCTLKNAFKCQVGYSDHTMGIEIPIAAVALGAIIIEKHFTLNRNSDGPDHKASLEPHELKQMVTAIHNIEMALGDGIKRITLSEQKNKNIVQKSLVASKTILKGEIFSEQNMVLKRVGTGILPDKWDEVIGKKANKDFQKDDLIKL
jgi:N-acetylneuraminate synthase/N,N'-diacetyllegionaminate synthase